MLHCSARIISLPVENILMQLLMQSVPMADPLGEYDKVKTQVILLSVGTAQLLTIPGEALPNIGFYLKRKMPARHPFLLGLANDAFGYCIALNGSSIVLQVALEAQCFIRRVRQIF